VGVVLAVDTAGPVIGVAAVEDSALVASWSERVSRGAERALHPAISRVLQGRRADAIAISIGPGAFTGLRVGVAAALGLAKAWGVPVLPTSSLAARAAMVSEPAKVLSLLDARKGKVYAGLYDLKSGRPIAMNEEQDVEPTLAVPDGPGIAIGEGVVVVEDLLTSLGWQVAEQYAASPVEALAIWGEERWRAGEAVAAQDVRLRYLRPPDAKLPKIQGLLQPRNGD